MRGRSGKKSHYSERSEPMRLIRNFKAGGTSYYWRNSDNRLQLAEAFSGSRSIWSWCRYAESVIQVIQ